MSDERTGVGRERANAAYVAARANRDVWPRNEKTGCVVMSDERTGSLWWRVWRDGIQHHDAEPWAAETYDWMTGPERRWFATWREAYDYARAHVNEETRG